MTENKSTFTLKITIEDGGTVDIVSEGLCHHLFLVGVLESIKADVLNVAANMQGFVPTPVTELEEKNKEGENNDHV